MLYFRAHGVAECNVYMNYSFWEPHFSLMARHPERLSADERSFLHDFNDAFESRVAPSLVSPCKTPVGSVFLSAARKRELYDICVAAETRRGVAEASWGNSPVAAPSNCMSSRLSHAGVQSLIAARLPTPSMSLDAWMRLPSDSR